MPGQPLPRNRRNPAHWQFTPQSLQKRRDHALCIADAMAMWSSSEIQMGFLLASLLRATEGTATDAAVAVYAVLRRSAPRYEALTAAGAASLSGRDMELLSAVLLLYQAAEAERNKLAHGAFGTHDQMPDSILWIDSQALMRLGIDLLRREDTTRSVPPIEAHAPLSNKIRHYTISDLEAIGLQIHAATNAVFNLTRYLRRSASAQDNPLGDALYAQVCSFSPIQEALRGLRENAYRNKRSIPLRRYARRRQRQ